MPEHSLDRERLAESLDAAASVRRETRGMAHQSERRAMLHAVPTLTKDEQAFLVARFSRTLPADVRNTLAARWLSSQ